jgi:hypothetical protein
MVEKLAARAMVVAMSVRWIIACPSDECGTAQTCSNALTDKSGAFWILPPYQGNPSCGGDLDILYVIGAFYNLFDL